MPIANKIFRVNEAAIREQLASPEMAQRIPNAPHWSRPKIFEVQSAATGYGVYNCYEQVFDSTYWGSASAEDRLKEKETTPTNVEVFNLYENDIGASYSRALALYDRLVAWRINDDESKARYIGIPLDYGPRYARTNAAAGAATFVTCNLYLNNGVEAAEGQLGYNITVYGNVTGGNNLDHALPYLANDTNISVLNYHGKWWFVQSFPYVDLCT